tara:strand:+ start:8124 stop:9449 length:1326 start_codon:yes stop_codon:yes gene_type:complete
MSETYPGNPLEVIFSERGQFERYLQFEAALAEAEAELGLIPEEAAREIVRVAVFETLDMNKLNSDTLRTGYPIAPMVRQLTAACRDDLGQFVHWGSTTQDVMDTGLVLQIRDSLIHIEDDLKQLARSLADLAQRHRDTLMVARTFGGHALPFTFGAKVARWLSSVCRHLERLEQLRPRVLVGEFGGAVGTLASFGTHGAKIRERLMSKLELAEPLAVWHAARDSVAECATFLGLVTSTLGKIGHDVTTLCTSDVGEVFEPVSGGRDASSTLPQKQNPVYSGRVVANARVVASHVSLLLEAARQDHERGPQGFIEKRTLPDTFVLTGETLVTTLHIIGGLRVDEERMRANLDASGGTIMAEAATMALSPHLGRLKAKDLVHDACERVGAESVDLVTVLGADPEVTQHLTPEQLARTMDPANYLGNVGEEIDRVVAHAREVAQ